MRIVLVALLAACGSDPGPHDVVNCPTGFGKCERACTATAVHQAPDCIGMHDGNTHVCMDTAIDDNGVTGCCAPPAASEMSTLSFVFYECP